MTQLPLVMLHDKAFEGMQQTAASTKPVSASLFTSTPKCPVWADPSALEGHIWTALSRPIPLHRRCTQSLQKPDQ